MGIFNKLQRAVNQGLGMIAGVVTGAISGVVAGVLLPFVACAAAGAGGGLGAFGLISFYAATFPVGLMLVGGIGGLVGATAGAKDGLKNGLGAGLAAGVRLWAGLDYWKDIDKRAQENDAKFAQENAQQQKPLQKPVIKAEVKTEFTNDLKQKVSPVVQRQAGAPSPSPSQPAPNVKPVAPKPAVANNNAFVSKRATATPNTLPPHSIKPGSQIAAVPPVKNNIAKPAGPSIPATAKSRNINPVRSSPHIITARSDRSPVGLQAVASTVKPSTDGYVQIPGQPNIQPINDKFLEAVKENLKSGDSTPYSFKTNESWDDPSQARVRCITVEKAGEPIFNIYNDRVTSNHSDVDAFKAMITSFKTQYPDRDLEITTTAELKDTWVKACQEMNIDLSLIHI